MVEYMKRHASGFICPQCAKYVTTERGRVVDGCKHHRTEPEPRRKQKNRDKNKGGDHAI